MMLRHWKRVNRFYLVFMCAMWSAAAGILILGAVGRYRAWNWTVVRSTRNCVSVMVYDSKVSIVQTYSADDTIPGEHALLSFANHVHSNYRLNSYTGDFEFHHSQGPSETGWRYLSFPLWLVSLGLAVGAAFLTRRVSRSAGRIGRVLDGQCVVCAYDLRGQREQRCPECGTPFESLGPPL